MRIKLYENVTSSAAPVLRAFGHDVDTVAKEGLMGADDPTVLAAATDDGRLLVSLDRGLGDVRAYPPGTHGGTLVIRLDHQSPQRVREAMQLIATAVDLATLAGGVSVWGNGAPAATGTHSVTEAGAWNPPRNPLSGRPRSRRARSDVRGRASAGGRAVGSPAAPS